jgi:hypothetical protein
MSKLIITPYTDKSFVILGETLEHSTALGQLGGKYNPNLKIGPGWIFSKVREDTVRNYIQTGEIKPYVYTMEDKAKYNKYKQNDNSVQLKMIFEDLFSAFDSNCEYEGNDIIDVIKKVQQKYLQIQDTPKMQRPQNIEEEKPTKRLAKKAPEIPITVQEVENNEDFEEKPTKRLAKKITKNNKN